MNLRKIIKHHFDFFLIQIYVVFSVDIFTNNHIFSASDSNQSDVYIIKHYHGYETLDMYDQCLSQ